MNKKICVIGAGSWGKNHIKTLYELNSLGGIVESNSNLLSKYKSEYPNINCFNNIADAINFGFNGFVIATPAETHYEIAKVILEAKYPVLIEKPITTNVKDAISLNQIAKSNNVSLMVGHLLLFHPAFIKMKSMIQDGNIGDLQYMYSNRLNLGTIRSNENVLWSFAPHDISLFQYLVESESININCSGNDHLQEGIHDTTITTIEYPQKIMGHIFVSWLHPFKEHRFIVIGSKGMIHFEDSKEDKPLKFYNKLVEWEKGKPIINNSDPINIEYNKEMPLKLELEYFIKNLDNPDFDKANGQNAIEVMKILEKATDKLIKDKICYE